MERSIEVFFSWRTTPMLMIALTILPIGSMYGLFTYMYQKNQPNVGKYTMDIMDGMGHVML